MKTTYIRVGRYHRPSAYFYKVTDVDHKHPYIRKDCKTCGKRSMQKTRSKGFCSRACAKIAELNPNFNPDSAYKRYTRVQLVGWHQAVYKERGQPQHCTHCGTEEKRMYHWANVSGHYEDTQDYIRLCVPCHARFDRKK